MVRTGRFLVLFLIDFCFKQNTMGFIQNKMGFKHGGTRRVRYRYRTFPVLAFTQCCGSGSGRIRTFLQDPDPNVSQRIRIPDPDPSLSTVY
jgi:hypothetical protein